MGNKIYQFDEKTSKMIMRNLGRIVSPEGESKYATHTFYSEEFILNTARRNPGLIADAFDTALRRKRDE